MPPDDRSPLPLPTFALTAWNVALNQASWFAVVLGAAWGHPVVGALLGLVPIVLHLVTARERGPQLRFMGEAVLVGLVVESVNAALGLYLPHSGAPWPNVLAPWLLVLWAGFAMAFDRSLSWLSRSSAVAAMVGAVAGPLSFWSGARLGAVTLSPGLTPLAVLAVEWALVLPLLAWRADAVLRPRPVLDLDDRPNLLVRP